MQKNVCKESRQPGDGHREMVARLAIYFQCHFLPAFLHREKSQRVKLLSSLPEEYFNETKQRKSNAFS